MIQSMLHIAVPAAGGLAGACAASLALVLLAAALVLRFGRGAPERRRWARYNKTAFVAALLAFSISVLYGGSKGGGTNVPPVVPPVAVRVWVERLWYDPAQERFIPVWTPLRRVDP